GACLVFRLIFTSLDLVEKRPRAIVIALVIALFFIALRLLCLWLRAGLFLVTLFLALKRLAIAASLFIGVLKVPDIFEHANGAIRAVVGILAALTCRC